MIPLGTFDEFYNRLCDIEERETSWVDQDYAEEIAEKKWQRYLQKKYIEANKSSVLKYREVDLRRKLLHRIGKYELEEGEIFE
jgi:hypothetical protein